jgi:hypothetical protein
MQGSTTCPKDLFSRPLQLRPARSAAAAPPAVKAGRDARPAGVALTAGGRRRQSKGRAARRAARRRMPARSAGGRERSGDGARLPASGPGARRLQAASSGIFGAVEIGGLDDEPGSAVELAREVGDWRCAVRDGNGSRGEDGLGTREVQAGICSRRSAAPPSRRSSSVSKVRTVGTGAGGSPSRSSGW